MAAPRRIFGGEGSGETEPGMDFESLLAQLRRTSNQDTSTALPPPQQQQQQQQQSLGYHDLPSQFNKFQRSGEYYYGEQRNSDPPGMSDSFTSAMSSHLPAAPTPPGGSFPNAPFPPNTMGTIGSGRPNGNGERATSSHLLNLLKFSGQGGQAALAHPSSVPQEAMSRDAGFRQSSAPLAPDLIHAPAPSASDPTGLLAALMQGHLKDEPPKPEAPAATQSWNSTSQSTDTQQYLLNLLNRPKPSQNDGPFSAGTPKDQSLTPQSASGRNNDHSREYSSLEEALATDPQEPAAQIPVVPTSTFDFESPKPKFQESPIPKPSIFNYANPFDDLAATSPLNRTPKSSTTPGATDRPAPGSQSSAVPIHILKKPRLSDKRPGNETSPITSPAYIVRKVDSTSPHVDLLSKSTQGKHAEHEQRLGQGKSKETVAAAVSDLAGKADKEAQEALARAEEERAQAEIAKDMEDLLQATTEKEFQEAAQIAGQAIKKELEKEDKQDILETTLSPELAKAVRDIVDEAASGIDAANGPVADSWESAEADADEIVVIEEEVTPVKVYNFPMKPWISITVQDQDDVEDSRPTFRDEAILDIARLKKEFDQIDRNLVTASETYIGYGMSKAGGLRVIRQEDGKDAKLFTDTKDRVFNVAMSSTSLDHGTIAKDAIIGTGISGTVYWIQIRDGDKDHLEDAHPEQYGFALPPISSQEGDAPGGVLKTRARTSSSRPEYFAVGRGKTINIIWPTFILQNKIFKPGHDRVVDTEKLSQQCSLKINTGKAGKDFTFSRDDTVVVSLDKSGRVKFWDVRDLTAAKEDSDPRNPMPARTHLEVKEPLMTLTTTPEGEKAWPTSVLLLDKLRPYQKRCALRYMIVGMKQNHTLQLWDLALGKPVQEFNLPHSKESDAVCSVVYHPPTGMIAVGHPTRNSIYFLHLSAPKYGMKSLSQVDYMQRLTAQDSSIPQPESTAVISGIREYSLATKGTLRSLDILPSPSRSVDSDEQTLFELYAMHSKGVTCIAIKQGDLGWSKDNKVMDPVDAVETGVVKIGKLKSPLQPTIPAESHGIAESTPQISRIIASRSTAKDLLPTTPSQDDSSPRKGPESGTPAKVKPEPKEDEASTSHPVAPVEKPDKKGRKKKAAAAATMQPERELNVQSNGSSSSPRVSPAKNVEPAKPSSLPPPASIFSQEAVDSRIDTMEGRICERLSGSVHVAFENIKKDMLSQFRNRDADFEVRQKNLLDTVSQVLNNNTEQVLGKIVRDEFHKGIVPALRDDVTRSLSDQLGNKFNQQISHAIQREVNKALPGSVSQSLKSHELSKSISDRVILTVNAHIDDQLGRILTDRIVPSLTSRTAQVMQSAARDIHEKTAEHLVRLEQNQQIQDSKFDSLMSLVTRLSDTVSSMAVSQNEYQTQLLKLQNTPAMLPQPQPPAVHHQPISIPLRQPRGPDSDSLSFRSPATRISHQAASSPQGSAGSSSHHTNQIIYAPKSKEERDRLELDEAAEFIDALLKEGRADEAMMRWLQSNGKEQELFDRVLLKYNPDIIMKLHQPLVLLSVGTTISNELMDFKTIPKRLAWIEMVVLQFYPMVANLDDQTREITPKILGHIKTRLEQVFMRISSVSPNDPGLKNLAQMTSVVEKIMNQTVSRSVF